MRKYFTIKIQFIYFTSFFFIPKDCLITVHDSSCRDQILDCNRFSLAKKPNQLTLQVPGSVGNLTTIGYKTGSNSPTHGQQNLTSSPLNASASSLSSTVNQTVSSTNLLSNFTIGMTNSKQSNEIGSAGYSTPLGATPGKFILILISLYVFFLFFFNFYRSLPNQQLHHPRHTHNYILLVQYH